MATWMDDSVGAVLRALDGYGLARNTIVLFISDNPTRGKNTCYEGARVPALVRWPARVRPGARLHSLCANLDIGATLIEAAGGAAPADMRLDGRSFLAQLTGAPEPKDWRRHLLLEIHNSRAVVTRRWKYIANRVSPELAAKMRAEASGPGPRTAFWNGVGQNRFNADADFPAYFDADQLYDLDADLYERRNLAAQPGPSEVLADMKKRLVELLAPLPHTFGEFRTA
jgi:arylsulfatase A-like enzyme